MLKTVFDNKTILYIVGCTFLMTVGRGISLPFLPLYLHHQLQLDTFQTGVTLTIAMVLGVFLSIPVGRLADKVERKLLSKSVLVIFIGAFVLIGLIKSAIVFVICFTLINCCYSVYSTLIKCYISDSYVGKKKTELFSLNYTSINMGWVIGPVTGSLLLSQNILWSFLLSAVCGMLALAVGAGIFNAGQKATPAAEEQIVRQPQRQELYLLLVFTLAIFLGSFVFGRFDSCISQILMTETSEQTTAKIISIILTMNAITIVLFQYLIGVWVARLRPAVGFTLGALCLMTGIFLFSVSGLNVYLWAIATAIFTFGEVIFVPLQYSAIDMITTPGNKGLFFSFQNLGGLGGAINPVVTGTLLSLFSSEAVYGLLIIISGLCLLTFIAGIRLFDANRCQNLAAAKQR